MSDYRSKAITFKGKPSALEELKSKLLDFIEDNYPTAISTDWERGCAYALDEIEKIVKESEE